MKKEYSHYLIPGIIVIGVVLRVPFTSIPPIISHIAKAQHVQIGQLGMLTTMPLLAFALFSSLAPKVAQKLGLERAFSLMLCVMIFGSALRIIDTTFLYIGTLIIGIGIAHMNVLLPSVIRTYFPTRLGAMTSLYTFSMMIATAAGAGVAAPITMATNWRVFILILTVVLVIALMIWLPNDYFVVKQQTLTSEPIHVDTKYEKFSVWRNKYAWLLLFFAGMQSAMFYTLMAWGPTMAVQTGISTAVAGIFAGINALIGLPFALIVPTIVSRLTGKQRQIWVGITSLVGILGYLLLLYPVGDFGYWLAVNLMIGASAAVLFPYLMTTLSLKTSSAKETAALSGMTQSGGYLLAALGPALFGYAYSWFNSWLPQLVVMLILFILMAIAIITVEKQNKIL